MNAKPKITVLHGASLNGGDFLIYRRGRDLLEKYLKDKLEFTYLPRFQEIEVDETDGLIILGGPILTRKMHPQTMHIKKLIEKLERKRGEIPVVTLGIGVSSAYSPSYKEYFTDEESVRFWKRVYESSKLVSVRDVETKKVLEAYGIKPRLTGCPALYNMEWEAMMPPKKIDSILISLPGSGRHKIWNLKHHSNTSVSYYLLKAIKRKMDGKKIGVAFQHGFNTKTMEKLEKLAGNLGMETHDISGKSIDETEVLEGYSMHIGPRLHLHIAFLTSKKPSYLLDIDLRTHAFLNTINTPHESFTKKGVDNILQLASKDNSEAFKVAESEINRYRKELEKYMADIGSLFLK